MSKITNDGLTRSGTGCFIAVPIWQQWASAVMLAVLQEYLEYQRQLALQRMQEQEMEMRRRLEQQKQEQHMRAMQYTYPQVRTDAPTYLYDHIPACSIAIVMLSFAGFPSTLS